MSRGYALDQCALYAIGSKARLARRLGRSPNFLVTRAFDGSLYREWQEAKSNGGSRTIEAPRDDLKAIQRRIADLLQRVLAPKYLYSPVKGRSYVENALAHHGSREVRLLDVVNYFGNCDWRAVYRFFIRDMRCAPDVAWILAGLTTRRGHLPQGSPCSPILSFYSCQNMWSEIDRIVEAAGCRLTVYVDDVTISGGLVPEALVWQVKTILHRYGHSHHRRKERRHFDRPAEITGIMIGPEKVSVPHRHFKKLQAARLAIRTAESEKARLTARARARSLEAQVHYLRQKY
jgi:hypothetical protein